MVPRARQLGKKVVEFGIIGAGLAGLACAEQLVATGHSVRIFDKGRGPGGRMSTRRIDTPQGQATFDHGAQFCTARHAGFAAQIADWTRRGITAPWPDAGPDAHVGVPGMSALVADLAQRHDVHFGTLVKGLVRDPATGGWWMVIEGDRLGPFDAVIVATPAEQAAPLLSLHAFPMAREAAGVTSDACWTMMLAFDAPLDLPWTVHRATDPDAAIAWAARNSAKPGRADPRSGAPDCWVVQAGAAWSRQHLERDASDIADLLRDEFTALAGKSLPEPLVATAHRWRFARPASRSAMALWEGSLRLGACGDWLSEPTVEGAWASGRALASTILARAKAA